MTSTHIASLATLTAFCALAFSTAAQEPSDKPHGQDAGLELICASKDGSHFVRMPSEKRFVVWGCNYDRDYDGRLLEDYWTSEWDTVVGDFKEMQALGINVVRVHLQLGRFMKSADEPDEAALEQLQRLLKLGASCGLYLDLTGLACYHKQDVPAWYSELKEADRWDVQARFWEAIAKTCKESNAVFCYDLMNEPILPSDKPEKDWLAGELGGKFFVQRISLDLAGRTKEAVAKAWVEKMVAAVHKQDDRHLITVGVIPWALEFPGAKPFFYSKTIGEKLDFVSVHFYPKKGKVDEAVKALAVYDVGKPLVVEEMFPIACSADELCQFVDRSRDFADGWISFYWGKPEDAFTDKDGINGAIIKGWLKCFREKGTEILKADR